MLNPVLWSMGVAESWIAQLFRESDVLLHTSYGEGFGMALLEAQACGLPVIATRFSAMNEMTFDASQKVDGRYTTTAHYANWMIPDVDEIVEALERLHANHRVTPHSNRIASDWIHERWSHDVIFERHWLPFLNRIESDLENASAEPVQEPPTPLHSSNEHGGENAADS